MHPHRPASPSPPGHSGYPPVSYGYRYPYEDPSIQAVARWWPHHHQSARDYRRRTGIIVLVVVIPIAIPLLCFVGLIFGFASSSSSDPPARYPAAGSNCAPPGFPSYPGAVMTDSHLGSGARQCFVTYTADADTNQLASYYVTQLNQGDWQVINHDTQSGAIRFASRRTPTRQGSVNFQRSGSHQTTITVTVDR